MGIESPVHLLFIALVALIVLGPRRLPSIARAIGQGIREFRGALEQAQEEDPEPPQAPSPAEHAPAPDFLSDWRCQFRPAHDLLPIP